MMSITSCDQLKGRRCHVIVSTPLQYLNAVELVTALECSERYLVVMEEYFTLEDFSRLPRFSEWTAVKGIHVSKPLPPPAGSLRRGLKEALVDRQLHRRFTRQLTHWPETDLVVMGNLRELRHHGFCGLAGGQETLICEDGTASLHGDSVERSRSKRLRRRLLGIEDHGMDAAWWFTAYPEAMGERRHIINRYTDLRSQLASRRRRGGGGDGVWLLGQPLAEINVLDFSVYLALVQGVVEQVYVGQALKYWPHPRESQENLVELDKIPGVEVMRRSQPIELELMKAKAMPERVVTFYSSAYQTCLAIFGDTVPFDILEPCYSYWPSDGVEVSILKEFYALCRQKLRHPNRFWTQGRDDSWRLLNGTHFPKESVPSASVSTELSGVGESIVP